MRVRVEVVAVGDHVDVVVRDEDGALLGVTQTDPDDGISVEHMARLWTSVTFEVPPGSVEVLGVPGGPAAAEPSRSSAD